MYLELRYVDGGAVCADLFGVHKRFECLTELLVELVTVRGVRCVEHRVTEQSGTQLLFPPHELLI